jgi:hypothetical protein
VKASSSSDTSLTMDAKLAEEVAKFQKNLFGFSILNPNLKGNPELGHKIFLARSHYVKKLDVFLERSSALIS